VLQALQALGRMRYGPCFQDAELQGARLVAGAVMLEVVTGYVMLGIMISILASKVARRS
jgi:hypothetical protein